MKTVQQSIEDLKLVLTSLTTARSGSFGRNITIDLSTDFVNMIETLIGMLERETFTRDELYVIFMALQRDGGPMEWELANRVNQMAKARVERGVVI